MRGNAELGDLVHIPGPDLDLDPLFERADNPGMERLIAVRLGRADIVFEAPRNHRILAVQSAKQLVALASILDHEPKCHDVGELLETNVLALHLQPD